MDKSFAIFDMDGTLVDSMTYWGELATEYLRRRGVKHVPVEVIERIRPMTMTESSTLFIQEFGLSGTVEEIVAEQNAIMEEHYRKDVPLKPGVREYLAKLAARGVTICVASATPTTLVEECLTRLGVGDRFRFFISCESVGTGKNRPDVYHAAAKRLDAEPEDIAVYEDAWYAINTAKAAGYYVVGVYDEATRSRWEQIKALSDEYIENWEEAL